MSLPREASLRAPPWPQHTPPDLGWCFKLSGNLYGLLLVMVWSLLPSPTSLPVTPPRPPRSCHPGPLSHPQNRPSHGPHCFLPQGRGSCSPHSRKVLPWVPHPADSASWLREARYEHAGWRKSLELISLTRPLIHITDLVGIRSNPPWECKPQRRGGGTLLLPAEDPAPGAGGGEHHCRSEGMGSGPALSEFALQEAGKPARLALWAPLSADLPATGPTISHWALFWARGWGAVGGRQGRFVNSPACRLDTYNPIQRAALCSANWDTRWSRPRAPGARYQARELFKNSNLYLRNEPELSMTGAVFWNRKRSPIYTANPGDVT